MKNWEIEMWDGAAQTQDDNSSEGSRNEQIERNEAKRKNAITSLLTK